MTLKASRLEWYHLYVYFCFLIGFNKGKSSQNVATLGAVGADTSRQPSNRFKHVAAIILLIIAIPISARVGTYIERRNLNRDVLSPLVSERGELKNNLEGAYEEIEMLNSIIAQGRVEQIDFGTIWQFNGLRCFYTENQNPSSTNFACLFTLHNVSATSESITFNNSSSGGRSYISFGSDVYFANEIEAVEDRGLEVSGYLNIFLGGNVKTPVQLSFANVESGISIVPELTFGVSANFDRRSFTFRNIPVVE